MFFYLNLLFKLFCFLTILLVVLVLGSTLWMKLIKRVCQCKTNLQGKTALVTGGNSGIGLETARDLARRGARVIIASRDNEKSEAAVADIINTTGNTNVEYKHLDLSKFRSIRRFCDDFNITVERLDIFVNNAGCGCVKRRATENGVDLIMQVNYLGPFLLTNLLLEKLIDSKPSRIVVVSSNASHFAKLDPAHLVGLNTEGYYTRYCNTKLCNVLWTKALAKRLPQRITANTLDPGVVKTDIFNHISPLPRKIILAVIQALFKTPEEGGQTSIHLCVAPELENTSGKFYSECKPSAIPRGGKNDALIEKVWRESMRLTES